MKNEKNLPAEEIFIQDQEKVARRDQYAIAIMQSFMDRGQAPLAAAGQASLYVDEVISTIDKTRLS